jgi:GTPase
MSTITTTTSYSQQQNNIHPAMPHPTLSKNTKLDALKQILVANGGEILVSKSDIPDDLQSASDIKIFPLDDGRHFMIRLQPAEITGVAEVRMAVIGNVDAGKSTILGVLTKGVLDDGRGRARANLFRHKHEHDSGRTSSIGQELVGFTADGTVIRHPAAGEPSQTNNHHLQVIPWNEVCSKASKVISFMDLAGHERYLKTTMFGLTGGAPDYAILMVGANAGMIGMSREHLTLAFGIGIPVIVIVTKVDICPPAVKDDTLRQVNRLLKNHQRMPLLIKDRYDVVFSVQQLQAKQKLCPIFQVSSVTGQGVDLVELMLNALPVQLERYAKDAPSEFYITDTYSVPGVGTVVAGTMISGRVLLGQTLFLGPDTTGAFVPATIKGIQRKRINVQLTEAGQCASFALKRIKRNAIRRGMVLVSHPENAGRTVREFSAEVIILFHSTTISPRYQAMLHCGVVRQTVSIVSLPQSVLRTGDRATVRFRFMRSPEYLRVGQRLLFREGRTKGVGRIVELHAD